MITEEQLTEKMKFFRDTEEWLINHRKKHFPQGALVRVNHPRFHGVGMVSGCSQKADQVPVQLQNGNIWWYEMDTCTVIHDLKQVPQDIRRMKLRSRNIRSLDFYGPKRRLP